MADQPWTREQDLAVLYAKLQYGRAFRKHPDIARLSDAMRRSEHSIVMRIANFDALDPSVSSGGLPHAARLTTEIWDEYTRQPDRIFDEARAAHQNLLNSV